MADNNFSGNKEFMSEIEDAKMEVGFNCFDKLQAQEPTQEDWNEAHFDIEDMKAEYGTPNNG